MTVKIGFIGTGNIAQKHLENLAKMADVNVCAFYDVHYESAEQSAKKWNDVKAYSQLDQMLDDRKPDAVYICIPPMAHGEAEKALLQRDIPFFVEKPLGLSLEQPRQCLQEIKAKQLITSTGYHWRHHDAVQKAKALLAERKPGMALGYWMGGMPKVPWWRDQKLSGGQFNEQTTHIVDLMRYLCGEVTEVYAAFSQRVMHEKEEGTTVADVGTVTMKLENGMVATISNTFMLNGSYKVGLDIITDQGVMEVRHKGLTLLHRKDVQVFENVANPVLAEDQAFVHAVRTGDPSGILANYEEAYKTLAVTAAANESAVNGEVVTV